MLIALHFAVKNLSLLPLPPVPLTVSVLRSYLQRTSENWRRRL